MEASTKSTQTNCNEQVYEKMKQYFDLFSENNAVATEDCAGDSNRAILLKHISLIEEFDREKEEMRAKFANEKESLKRAFANERKEYEIEIERLRNIVDRKIEEIEAKYGQQVEKREAIRREIFEKERNALRKSVQEQMDLVAEVESEIKRILKRLLADLKRYDISACKKLENDLCSKNIQESCVSWLKEIFDQNMKGNGKDGKRNSLGKVGGKRDGKGEGKIEGNEEGKENEERAQDELDEVGEVFRKQKKELTEIFMKEKKHLEEEIANNCVEYKKKLDKEYEVRVQNEMKVWQETIKEYEREIGILRYEREQMDRNYCLEIDRLKLETEKEKVEICSKYMKEREQLRRTLSDKVVNIMIGENGLSHVANGQQ